jgi:hypothetical protein
MEITPAVMAAAPGSEIAVDTALLESIVGLITKFAMIGGGLWLVWGVIVLAGGLKDKNGPALQAGIWQVVGGALIIAATVYFAQVLGVASSAA